MDNYIRAGAGVVIGLYVLFVEFRLMQLSRQVRLYKTREKDEEITEKIHVESDNDLDSSLAKHLSGPGDKT